MSVNRESLLRRFGRLLWGILRELADETAYQRHLKAVGRPPSPEEWRRFADERLRTRYARAKCC
jgi:hypothetical protein